MSVRRWTPPVAWAALILVLTSLPGSDIPLVDIEHADKLAHFGLYGVLGFLTVRAAWADERRWTAFAISLAAIALFGALDEWHQRLIPLRSTDLFDWLADVAGASLGGLIAAAERLRREPIGTPES